VLVLLYDQAFVSGSFRSALGESALYYVSLATTWLLLGLLMHHSSLAAISVGFQGRRQLADLCLGRSCGLSPST